MRLIFAALAALLLLPPAAQARDALVIGIGEFPSSLHPSIDPLLVKSYVLGLATRTVTTFDADNRLVCLLCTEVPTLENGLARRDGEGMAVTVKLRPDLRWGDGEPVTARDLAFTWRVGRDPDAGFSNTYPWTRASGVDVVDDHTAVLHLPRVLNSFALWDQVLPEHIEGPIHERAHGPGEYINTTEYNRNPLNPGLWNGPFVIGGYGSGLSVEFLTSTGFWPNELIQAVVQNAWKAVGVEATLRTEPPRTLFGQTVKHRAFPGLVMYSWSSLVGESPRITLGSDMVPTEANNWSGANSPGFSDPAFDEAIGAAETELDPAKRRAAWSTMQHIYAERLPALPLFIAVIPQALPTWLRGYGPNGTGQPFSQQAELRRSEP